MAKILAVVDNFLFKVKIQETAKHYGVQVDFAGEKYASLEGYDCIIIDANNPRISVKQFVEQLPPETLPKVICYLNHVQIDLAKTMQALGVSNVWPQSLFVKKFPDVLLELSKK